MRNSDDESKVIGTILCLLFVLAVVVSVVLLIFGVLEYACWPEGATENQCQGYAGDFRE